MFPGFLARTVWYNSAMRIQLLALSALLGAAASPVRAADAAAEDWSRIYLGARPSLCADGSRFAFEWNDHVWIAPSTGGVAQVVAADGAARASWPVLSPDAARIVFLSDRDGTPRPYCFDLGTGRMTRISPHAEQTLPWMFAADGRSVLASVLRDDADPRHARRIARLLVPGPSREEILFDAAAEQPALAPDGARLLFVRNAEHDLYRKSRTVRPSAAGEIWLYDLQAKTFTPVVRKPTRSSSPLWAPDGKGFYYVSAEGGTSNVRHRDLATGVERAVTAFADDGVLQPTLSADGRVMVLRRGLDFWRLDPTAATPAPRRLVLHPGPGWTPPASTRNRLYSAARNPDGGEHVAFFGEGDEIAFAAGGRLYVMGSSTREPVEVDGSGLSMPSGCAFAPDGSALYYLLDHGDAADIWVARKTAPGKPWHENAAFRKTCLLRDGAYRTALSLSPNGTRLAWLDAANRLVFADTNAQHAVKGPDRRAAATFAWSPNGKWIAAGLSDDDGQDDIWVVATDGKRAPYNVSRHYQWDGEPAWSPDGKLLAWSGRRDEGTYAELLYVFLDNEEGRGKARIDFDGLHERVKRTKVRGHRPFFNKDSRTVAFDAGAQTSKIKLPGALSPARLTARRGTACRWGTEKDAGRLLWRVDGVPAHFERSLPFSVRPVFDLPDHHELLFRSAWRRIRDRFYDKSYHGADWPAMKDKYLPAFRHATSYSVLQRLMGCLLGELDASHLGFLDTQVAKNEWHPNQTLEKWYPVVAHLGLRFDPAHRGPGWKVRDVLRDGPADLARRGIRAGDLVTEVDGVKTDGSQDPAQVLLGPADRKVSFTFGHPGEPATNSVRVKSISWTAARDLLDAQHVRDLRERVHAATSNRVGYVFVPKMNMDEFRKFENEVFSEGYGRDALVVDVRGNTGGFTADRMLDILCPQDHSYEIPRHGNRGYLMSYTVHPVWKKPLAVICDGRSASNGEIFSHAVKTLGRGVLVGQATGGRVIATNNRPILDFGDMRDAEYGWYLPDGTDMEGHGAEPDIPVALTPADEVRGADPQLDAAVQAVLKQIEIEEQKKESKSK